jgi:hypothetical protein
MLHTVELAFKVVMDMCSETLLQNCFEAFLVFPLLVSPGGVSFEAAPFKLTRELLEVMDSNSEGRPSELFDYFKVGLTGL